jgi:hypothetical protein
VDRSVEQEVWRRADGRCEYCQISNAVYRTPFQIDHVIARQHGGRSDLQNLALACFHCNTHKGPNIAGVDPATGRIVRLFNPRLDRWTRHFAWDGPEITGLTPIGRATLRTLALNHPDYLSVRRALIVEGVSPGRPG